MGPSIRLALCAHCRSQLPCYRCQPSPHPSQNAKRNGTAREICMEKSAREAVFDAASQLILPSVQWLDVADSEVRRLRPCLLFPACPTASPPIERSYWGSAIPAPLPCSFSNLEWISSSPHLQPRKEVYRGSCVDVRGRVTMFGKKGASNFELQDAELKLQRSNLLLPPTQISALLVAALSPGTQRPCTSSARVEGAHENVAGAQSVYGAARQKLATSSCGIFLIGLVVTQRHSQGRACTLTITEGHCREGRDGATTSREVA
ncbi:uncharacterized protein PAC_19018 [Phialocephala subalpina]|uniref:Uncharacterized protein n=1 Tax=Phialocephala subalpina TaxID=576137 RepID=A0A1L7XVS7_9HELO|nr:uncharacterized protein PAC_19018 [Phialocephala subalpina]